MISKYLFFLSFLSVAWASAEDALETLQEAELEPSPGNKEISTSNPLEDVSSFKQEATPSEAAEHESLVEKDLESEPFLDSSDQKEILDAQVRSFRTKKEMRGELLDLYQKNSNASNEAKELIQAQIRFLDKEIDEEEKRSYLNCTKQLKDWKDKMKLHAKIPSLGKLLERSKTL